MSLIDLADNSRTDKNTSHSYLELYDSLLCSKKYTAQNVLEVGIQFGGSIKLWKDYFTNAHVYGLDIMTSDKVWDVIKNDPRIILFTSIDAYNEDFFNHSLLKQNIKFDMVLDDGPHTLESMKQFIKLYSQLLNNDGILIIEDIPDFEWTNILTNVVPDNLKKYIRIYDLRNKKGRWDDIVLVINKSI